MQNDGRIWKNGVKKTVKRSTELGVLKASVLQISKRVWLSKVTVKSGKNLIIIRKCIGNVEPFL